jgi:ABC-type antimicrobial peptide transport system ATPase subunit
LVLLVDGSVAKYSPCILDLSFCRMGRIRGCMGRSQLGTSLVAFTMSSLEKKKKKCVFLVRFRQRDLRLLGFCVRGEERGCSMKN